MDDEFDGNRGLPEGVGGPLSGLWPEKCPKCVGAFKKNLKKVDIKGEI
jgi:hypothetical protein